MQFAPRLLQWHQKFGRHHLPWQQTENPYFIWASEIMLQQTQVITVIPYYLKLIQKFPSVEDLANCSMDDFLGFWSGLGYYQRAKHMIRCAQIITSNYHGQFPNQYDLLLQLPGIGPSTAAAIMAQAFNAPYAILDGNVKRVLSRLHGLNECIDSTKGMHELWHLANHHMPKTECRTYTQAIMDLGATVCQKNPQCGICPMSDICEAHKSQLQNTLPIRKKKRPVSEFIISCHVYRNSQKEYGLIQRPCSGIWQDLLFFPPSAKKGNQSIKQTHLLTHRKLEISYEIQHTEPLGITHWLTKEQLLHSAIPNALRRVIGEIDHVFNLGDSV